jgi:hypothetical protein
VQETIRIVGAKMKSLDKKTWAIAVLVVLLVGTFIWIGISK